MALQRGGARGADKNGAALTCGRHVTLSCAERGAGGEEEEEEERNGERRSHARLQKAAAAIRGVRGREGAARGHGSPLLHPPNTPPTHTHIAGSCTASCPHPAHGARPAVFLQSHSVIAPKPRTPKLCTSKSRTPKPGTRKSRTPKPGTPKSRTPKPLNHGYKLP